MSPSQQSGPADQPRPKPLEREEYIEQAYLFQLLHERIADQIPMQELLEQVRHELLSTTKLPLAIDFMLTDLKHQGLMGPAMRRLKHYFTPIQSYLIEESESETGRFATATALQILHVDAKLRSESAKQTTVFFFHFETLCRNRLSYDRALNALSGDPVFDASWARWLSHLRAQVGLVDFADLMFLASEEYRDQLLSKQLSVEGKGPFLFGAKEGKIALANRLKDPLFLFGAMQRHLDYPAVPRPVKPDQTLELLPQLARRMERLEQRIQLMEQDQRSSLDISKFYEKPE
ncbi:MAG: hypothetical protein AAGA03_14660 [Planctomycetota bacterium]